MLRTIREAGGRLFKGGWEKRMIETRRRLDKVSPSFCAAKWLQTTLYLQTGQTHSCCLMETHQIPPAGLAVNPAGLHNTPFKKEMRRLMLEGKRPPECRYCWESEDASPGHYSERHIKSGDPWAAPFIEDLAASPWDADVDPTYLEVNFGLDCGLRCMYCAPYVSSAVLADYKANGPYPVTHPVNAEYLARLHKLSADLNPLPPDNAYVRAFWQWFPALLGRLRVLRLTGGEPLLNANTFKVLDFLEANPSPGLELCVNSSLCVEAGTYDRFVKQCRRLLDGGKVAGIVLFTSLEAHGVRSNYIRAGSDYNLVMANCRRWLDGIPAGTKLVFMSTFNILSFTSFGRFAVDVLELKKKYSRGERQVILDIAALNEPYYLRPIIASPDLVELFRRAADFMRGHVVPGGGPGFSPYEVNKAENLLNALLSPAFTWPGLNVSRKDLAVFLDEYDRRRGSDFASTFPDMAYFTELCRNAKEAL